jgi:hypothetical protein
MKKICIAILLASILIISTAYLERAQADDFDWLTGLWAWEMVFSNGVHFDATVLCTRSGIIINCEKVRAIIQDGRLLWQFSYIDGWVDTHATVSPDRRHISFPQNEATVTMTRK